MPSDTTHTSFTDMFIKHPVLAIVVNVVIPQVSAALGQLATIAIPGVTVGLGQLTTITIPQVTAAALVSENKMLAHPASVDSIPTSANQEDHVSMATYAARRLAEMADNTATILAIEWLAAAQGVDFHRPLHTSTALEATHAKLRSQVAFYDQDRLFAPDIEAAKRLVMQGAASQGLDATLQGLWT